MPPSDNSSKPHPRQVENPYWNQKSYLNPQSFANKTLEKILKMSFLNNLLNKIFGKSQGTPSNMSDSAKTIGRPMKFPYTFSAKIAQFPMKFYIKNCWLIKYYLMAVVVSAPVFYKIGKLSYAPENVKTWEEIRRKEFSGHH